MRVFLTAAFLLSVSCAGSRPAPTIPTGLFSSADQAKANGYATPLDEVMHETTVMIVDNCGVGTGVVIGPRTVLTAKHMVQQMSKNECKPHSFLLARVEVGEPISPHPITTDHVRAHSEADLAVINLPTSYPAFKHYAKVLPRKTLRGEKVCWVSVDAEDSSAMGRYQPAKKCGYISSRDDTAIIVSGARGVSGNSGAGILTEDGFLVGILTHVKRNPLVESNVYAAPVPENVGWIYGEE